MDAIINIDGSHIIIFIINNVNNNNTQNNSNEVCLDIWPIQSTPHKAIFK